jgi:hypothetical protein
MVSPMTTPPLDEEIELPGSSTGTAERPEKRNIGGMGCQSKNGSVPDPPCNSFTLSLYLGKNEEGYMKSTDIDRIDREFKRARKKEELIEKRLESRAERSVGDYIKKLYSLFYHDGKKIYNLKDNADILTLFVEMKEDLPESKWDNVLRKAIKETKIEVKQRELIFDELRKYLSMAE